jgi:hypothetical protein
MYVYILRLPGERTRERDPFDGAQVKIYRACTHDGRTQQQRASIGYRVLIEPAPTTEALSIHLGGNPRANRWFLRSTSIQTPPELVGICERLTEDLPLGCLQGGQAHEASTTQRNRQAPAPPRLNRRTVLGY